MKVLQLLKTSRSLWAYRQMRELVKLGVEVHVALPAGGPLIPRYQQAGIDVHLVQLDLPVKAPWRIPKVTNTLAELVATVKPDLIHSHFVGTTLSMRLALGRKHPTPRIFQVPGPLHLEHSFFRQLDLRSAGAPDYWVGSCQWTCQRYLASGIDRQRVFLSYYGIDCETAPPQTHGKLRSELKIAADHQIVGMVAFMYAPKRYLGQKRGLKGHEDLIDAVALLLRHNPTIQCVFVGGAYNGATAYEASVRAYGNERLGTHGHFLGSRNDVLELYADIDVAVHPSHSENLGGALESLYMGVPTIASSVGGFPDIVRPGETGMLVPPKDPASLARMIQRTFDNLPAARQLALSGQRLIKERLDVRKTAQEIVDIYHKILTLIRK
jgi:glycosyltransferase involved in cell wall biosynthesis